MNDKCAGCTGKPWRLISELCPQCYERLVVSKNKDNHIDLTGFRKPMAAPEFKKDDTEKPKPCPNCGEKVIVSTNLHTSYGLFMSHAYCYSCTLSGPAVKASTQEIAKVDAVGAWNALPRRMQREEARALVDAFGEAVDLHARDGAGSSGAFAVDWSVDVEPKRRALIGALTGAKGEP